MSQRLFVAIDLSGEARAAIVEATADLRARLRDAGMDDAFRWVASANLHLTLRFLGNVPDDAADAARAAMALPLNFPQADIEIGDLGTFPARGRPRVLHAGLARGREALGVLRDSVDARLAPVCRWEPETRPFAPHLTLARARDRAKIFPEEFSRLIAATPWPHVRFRAAQVTLFSSRTLPSGPEYTSEARAALISR